MNARPKAVAWSTLPESQRRRLISRLSQLALRQLSAAGGTEGRNDERRNCSTTGAEREGPGRPSRSAGGGLCAPVDSQPLARHQESTRLQYGLVERAVDLGGSRGRIEVIDEDLGTSGATAEGRAGFQRRVSEVTLNHVGIVLGIEMSRLARSCRDGYPLLEVCGLFGTLIGDRDGIYDPTDYNDRLLRGLNSPHP